MSLCRQVKGVSPDTRSEDFQVKLNELEIDAETDALQREQDAAELQTQCDRLESRNEMLDEEKQELKSKLERLKEELEELKVGLGRLMEIGDAHAASSAQECRASEAI